MINNYNGVIDFQHPFRFDTKEMLDGLLTRMPEKRFSCEEALEHKLFTRIESYFDVDPFVQQPTLRNSDCQTKRDVEESNREKNPSLKDIDPVVLKSGFFEFGKSALSNQYSYGFVNYQKSYKHKSDEPV